MAFFTQALKANVMSTSLLIEANHISKKKLYEAYTIATDFEKRYSAYKKESHLSKINTYASHTPIACTQEDLEIFQRSLDASKLTQGAFDISIGSLSHGAYHFGFSNQKIASDAKIEQQKKLVNYKNISLQNATIFLHKQGMQLDLGGIGKGYVAKKIAHFLQKQGATKILVDVGGEICCYGKKYTIAIKNPFKDENLAYIKTSKEALSISTSGDYERFIKDIEHNHILSHKSGKSSLIYSSMTLIQNGFETDLLDAFATAMFNKDITYVQKFTHQHNFSAITIDKNANITLCNRDAINISSLSF